ncbi:MAG TPA: PAS domain S-box protein, partial [Pirellulales bacterium]|nr:PAS domain S-box protein [Pirellulales bacterium]
MLLNRFLSWWSAVRHGTPAQAAPSARPRATEADFRWLVEGVRDYAIFMLDPRGFILTWNRGGEHAYGYNPGDIIGQHFSVFYPADDIRARKPERDLELAAAQDTYEEEGWRVRKDGSQFWANVLITALRDGQGKLRGFSKVTRDMTERRLAEENVRSLLREEAARAAAEARAVEAERAKREEQRQRTQLQVTLSCIGDGVIVTDADGNVTFANPVAEVLTGWHSAEIIGKPLESVFNIVNEFTRVPPPNPVRRVLETGVTVGLANHTMLIARDGSERPIDDSAAPIRTDDGALIGVVLVFRDVTESRKA